MLKNYKLAKKKTEDNLVRDVRAAACGSHHTVSAWHSLKRTLSPSGGMCQTWMVLRLAFDTRGQWRRFCTFSASQSARRHHVK